MPPPLIPCRFFLLLGFLAAAVIGVQAQTALSPQGGEYSVSGGLPGDQTHPAAAISSAGGYIVWQDNATDGDGLGISGRKLNANLSPEGGSFRINADGAKDQQNPRVALLNGGGAVVVWQSGLRSFQRVKARFIGSGGVFATLDLPVSSQISENEVDPDVCVLANGTVAIVWSAFGQDGSMQGVFGQRFTPDGAKIGSEFQINQFTPFNQRNPAVAKLAGGGFVVAWISEQQREELSVELYGRVFDENGSPRGSEVRLNSSLNICANPALTGLASGGFAAAWSERPGAFEGWHVVMRLFDAQAVALNDSVDVNVVRDGRQFAPRIASVEDAPFVVWTSLWQDGSFEGVYGRAFTAAGEPADGEFRVNTSTLSQQLQPSLAADSQGRLLVAWSSFTGVQTSFDLFGQRYLMIPGGSILTAPVPMAAALDDTRVSVSWTPVAGYAITHYELFMDGADTPVTVSGTTTIIEGLAPGSSHTFRLIARMSGGRRSELSHPSAPVQLWGVDANGDGLPDDWQRLYWGAPENWSAADADDDGDGATNLAEFLAGTNPLDAQSVLRTWISISSQGRRLHWNTQPGLVYQAQISADLQAWSNLGEARFAPDATDSLMLEGGLPAQYYRVIRIR